MTHKEKFVYSDLQIRNDATVSKINRSAKADAIVLHAAPSTSMKRETEIRKTELNYSNLTMAKFIVTEIRT